MNQAYEFLKHGGPVMIPILLGSVLAMAIFFERLYALRVKRIAPIKDMERIIAHVRQGHYQEARRHSADSDTPGGRLLGLGIVLRRESRRDIKERLEESGTKEVASMNRFIEALGTIASVEPLLGLLGTVTGMIGVFKKVVGTASSGAVDPGELAGGIWQALITTAAGLSVAILAFIGYRYLQSRAGARAMLLEDYCDTLVDIIERERRTDEGEQ